MDSLKIIAHIHTDFPDKFGIPRQSGLVSDLAGKIVFEKEYRDARALKGMEDFTHLWIIWKFEIDKPEADFVPMVRPPRLGGNEYMGVFATRSPFRPNPIGLSSVKLERIDYGDPEGPVIYVSGIDMRNNTPIYDIKPYLQYVDAHSNATSGFAGNTKDNNLNVNISDELLNLVPIDKQNALIEILSEDPRPHYHNDSERVYGLSFANMNIRFNVNNNILNVIEITRL